jgi:hypothetical protein
VQKVRCLVDSWTEVRSSRSRLYSWRIGSQGQERDLKESSWQQDRYYLQVFVMLVFELLPLNPCSIDGSMNTLCMRRHYLRNVSNLKLTSLIQNLFYFHFIHLIPSNSSLPPFHHFIHFKIDFLYALYIPRDLPVWLMNQKLAVRFVDPYSNRDKVTIN